MPDMHFSQYIAGIYRRSKNETNRQLTALNIRATQSDLMMFIAEHPGRQQQQIAREMSVDASLLARDLTVLTQKGWVTRTPSTTDGRAKEITLTATGQRVATQLTTTMTAWWQQLMQAAGVAAPELDRQLATVYRTLIARERDV
ncbi:MarR family winged helix-turn-helix transcriptional regulator [Levilactobacillus suantsaii]|nr:MarR family transcriptional regulator [Levilactobacillus suantsaii]QMU08880.1 MarR family transcriptional regulator [Levilactobacillus suantsaii]